MNIDLKILAYGLISKKNLLMIRTDTNPEYFAPEYRQFYKLLMKCFIKYQEIPTPRVMEEHSNGLWNEDWLNLYNSAAVLDLDEKELSHDLEALKIRYNKNLILKYGQSVFREGYDGTDFDDLHDVNTKTKELALNISSIYGKKVYKEGSLADTVAEAWAKYRTTRDNPDASRGIMTGFSAFDEATGGVRPAELVFIGGESGSGKSALSMNMAINAWKGRNNIDSEDFDDSGANVIYFTIEMPYEVLRRRVDACLSGIHLNGIRDGNLTPSEIELFRRGLKFQKNYHKQFHIVDIPRGCTVAQIESKYLEKIHEFSVDLIIVDYISLMTLDKDVGADWLNLGHLAEQLHEFCRSYNVPVISPVQLNRPPKNGNGGISKADQHRIGRSIMIPQNANIVLNIETRPDEENRRDMVARFAKNRDGALISFILHKQLNMMRVFDNTPGWEEEIQDV